MIIGPPFRSGKVFMFSRAIDHAFYVKKIVKISHGCIVLSVANVNLGYTGVPFMMPGPKQLKINQSQYPFYVELTDKDLAEVRKSPGLPSSAKIRFNSSQQNSARSIKGA